MTDIKHIINKNLISSVITINQNLFTIFIKQKQTAMFKLIILLVVLLAIDTVQSKLKWWIKVKVSCCPWQFQISGGAGSSSKISKPKVLANYSFKGQKPQSLILPSGKVLKLPDLTSYDLEVQESDLKDANKDDLAKGLILPNQFKESQDDQFEEIKQSQDEVLTVSAVPQSQLTYQNQYFDGKQKNLAFAP